MFGIVWHFHTIIISVGKAKSQPLEWNLWGALYKEITDNDKHSSLLKGLIWSWQQNICLLYTSDAADE